MAFLAGKKTSNIKAVIGRDAPKRTLTFFGGFDKLTSVLKEKGKL